MRPCKKTKKFLTLSTILMSCLLLTATLAIAETGPTPVSAKLTFSKTSYTQGDPDEKIDARITLANTSGQDVLVQGGLTEAWYQLYLYFQGPEPDSPIITAAAGSAGGNAPTPQVPPPAVGADYLKAGWLVNMDIDEVRAYYPLTEPGSYKVWFEMPYVQYNPGLAECIDTNGDGIPDGYTVPPDAVLSSGTIKSAAAYVTLASAITEVASNVVVTATEYVFGEGTHPGVTKKPLTRIQVRLYGESALAAAGISPVNRTTYGAIASNALIPYTLAGKTGMPGEYRFEDVAKGGYLVLACASSLTGYQYVGQSLGAHDPNWGTGEISVNLILMADKNNKKAAGKSKKIIGSELFIVEPEYVEWTSDKELYPFAFESVGDWGVAVSVEPPEGFVTDYKLLTETVTSELEAIQFTITDVGSKWKPTKVKYRLQHEGKTTHMESKIDVKLSKKLAKKKNIGEWGEE